MASKSQRLVPKIMLERDPQFWAREVVFDLHGVVFDWLKGFVPFARRELGRELPKMEVSQIPHYDFQYTNCGFTASEYYEVFNNFARLARGGYGDLEPFPGVVEAMHRIRDAGIKIRIWTWTPGSSEISHDSSIAFGTGVAQGTTRALIARHKLPVDVNDETQLKFISPRDKAFSLAKEHIPLMVEDNAVTATAVGTGIGHACILVPTSYNEGLKARGVIRLDNRRQLASTVISFFKELDAHGLVL